MERIITCPVCWDSDQCFEEVQETFSSYLCFHCGFMSDSRYEISSLQLVENLKKSPILVQKLKFEDKHRNIAWFPSVINMGELGITYPEGTKTNWNYKLALVRKISEEEQKDEEEKEAMLAWNLTAKTILSVDEWISFYDECGYSGDYYWFMP